MRVIKGMIKTILGKVWLCRGCLMQLSGSERGPMCPKCVIQRPLDGQDSLEWRSGYSYDSKPSPHDFNHPELCKGKYSCVCCILCWLCGLEMCDLGSLGMGELHF